MELIYIWAWVMIGFIGGITLFVSYEFIDCHNKELAVLDDCNAYYLNNSERFCGMVILNTYNWSGYRFNNSGNHTFI